MKENHSGGLGVENDAMWFEEHDLVERTMFCSIADLWRS